MTWGYVTVNGAEVDRTPSGEINPPEDYLRTD